MREAFFAVTASGRAPRFRWDSYGELCVRKHAGALAVRRAWWASPDKTMGYKGVKRPVLTLCATYTLDPVVEIVEYWFDFLGIDVGLVAAPYAQLFQQLLGATSDLRRNQAGANAMLLRWTDLLPHAAGASASHVVWSEVQGRVAEVASALESFDHRVPCLVLVGPSDHHDPVLTRATAELQSRLAGLPNLFVEQGEHAMQRYGVEQIHDPASDRFGHVPFTPQAMVALGTTIARWYAALVRPPVKVVAVDGDHTLWSGVVAEEGADGVRIDDAHAGLQRALVEQHDAGRLVCLLSKNQEADVRSVFQHHPDMPLRWSHLVAHRVDWNTKPENLKDIVSELNLGLDSVVFLDDNPMECAEMRARCPAVATVRVPTDPVRLASFVDHLWLFDRANVTAEDRSRARMYREAMSRAELHRRTDSLQSFLDSLELAVEIAPPTPADVPRLAQLTQRTNQFNASLIRCDEQDLGRNTGAGQVFHRFVRARDRFGDYGIVGHVRARPQGDRLAVNLFMLSCRALGRGIEHRMVAAAGHHALSLGLGEVAVLFRRGERNVPARRFLEKVFGAPLLSDEQWFRMPAHLAAALTFDATMADADGDKPDEAQPRVSPAGEKRRDIGACYEHIAHALTTAAAIGQAIAERVRPRPDLAAGFVAPAAGNERAIASIWQQVLRIEPVGIHDRFQDLGGKSIHLVQVHSLLLDRLQLELDITTLFQHPTVSSLAAHLSTRTAGGGAEMARGRALKMREARARAAQRSGAPPA